MNDFHCELHKIYEVSGLTGPDNIYGSPVLACAGLLFIKYFNFLLGITIFEIIPEGVGMVGA